MCGLVGVASNLITEPVKKAFHDMLYFDTIRGEDSTGVAAISNPFTNPTVEVFKSLGPPSELFYEHGQSAKDRTLTKKPVGVYIGHNRYATQGKVTTDNAHPFEFENCVGAHNGTVSLYSLKDFHGYKEFDVDSKVIYSHLSYTQDIEEVWKNADGALALSWWDKARSQLNLIRNKERPLYIAYTEDDKTIMWASEAWMFVVAAMRHGIKLKDYITCSPNKLYTFQLGEGGVMRHTERDLPPFVAKLWLPPQQNSRGAWAGYDSWWDDDADYLPPVKKDKIHSIVIRELHDDSALGFTEDGTMVKVNITLKEQKEARQKIVGRGMSKGYYTTKHLFRNAQHPQTMFCYWQHLQWVKLKPNASIITTENHGFELQVTPSDDTSYAPWFAPEVSLTYLSYTDKVKCGCASCHQVPNWWQKDDIYWVDRTTFFCQECQSLPIVTDLIIEHNAKKKGVA